MVCLHGQQGGLLAMQHGSLLNGFKAGTLDSCCFVSLATECGTSLAHVPVCWSQQWAGGGHCSIYWPFIGGSCYMWECLVLSEYMLQGGESGCPGMSTHWHCVVVSGT
jgi:hypothetical protein